MIRLASAIAIYGTAVVAVGFVGVAIYVYRKSIPGPPLPKEYLEELRRLDGQ